MEINGTQLINESQRFVWDSLFNPEILKNSLPGCESVEVVSPEEFRIILTAIVGPLKVRFKGKLLMSDIEAPNSCHMAFEGQGGVAGFAKGTAHVALQSTADATQLSYHASAQIGGKLAQVGGRLIEGVAKKIADDFFVAFQKQLSGVDEIFINTSDMHNKSIVKASEPELASQKNKPLFHRFQSSTQMVPAWWLIVALFCGATIAIVSERLIN